MSDKQAYLQLRWTVNDGSTGWRSDGWLCHYELVIPLDENDIRREDEDGNDVQPEIIVALKPPTWRGGSIEPCSNDEYDAPFRDGAHALWDSAKLGDIPIIVIGLDGKRFYRTEKS